jgi:hypothetical protein
MATASLVCGISSIVLGLCIAIVGIGLSIAALVTGSKGLQGSKRSLAMAGMITGGIGLAVSIINSILGMMLFSGAFD